MPINSNTDEIAKMSNSDSHRFVNFPYEIFREITKFLNYTDFLPLLFLNSALTSNFIQTVFDVIFISKIHKLNIEIKTENNEEININQIIEIIKIIEKNRLNLENNILKFKLNEDGMELLDIFVNSNNLCTNLFTEVDAFKNKFEQLILNNDIKDELKVNNNFSFKGDELACIFYNKIKNTKLFAEINKAISLLQECKFLFAQSGDETEITQELKIFIEFSLFYAMYLFVFHFECINKICDGNIQSQNFCEPNLYFCESNLLENFYWIWSQSINEYIIASPTFIDTEENVEKIRFDKCMDKIKGDFFDYNYSFLLGLADCDFTSTVCDFIYELQICLDSESINRETKSLYYKYVKFPLLEYLVKRASIKSITPLNPLDIDISQGLNKKQIQSLHNIIRDRSSKNMIKNRVDTDNTNKSEGINHATNKPKPKIGKFKRKLNF